MLYAKEIGFVKVWVSLWVGFGALLGLVIYFGWSPFALWESEGGRLLSLGP
jgi:UPF0716 family protein affecting phage T7 exclusion